MGRSSNGQPALASVSSRQCRCAATCWNAGPHIAAFESPTRATVVVEAVSPVAHSGCPTSKRLRKQPLRRTGLSSAAASASGGSRFDGTALSSADAATAACTCANACCTAASYGVDVGARGGRRRGDRQRRSRRAAADRVRAPCSSATPTPTATAVAAPPSARLPAADRRKGAANRKRVLDEAQCEHGQPAGDQDRCQPGDQPQRVAQQWPARAPAPASATDTTSTTPGRSLASATLPGRGRIPEQVRHSRRRSPAPCPARATARRYPDRGWSRPTGCRPAGSAPALPIPRSRQCAGSRRHWPAVRATRPPTANCQARVGSEKNAIEGTT